MPTGQEITVELPTVNDANVLLAALDHMDGAAPAAREAIQRALHQRSKDDAEIEQAEREIARRVQEIDPKAFVSYVAHGDVIDPYGLYGGRLQDLYGRVEWVTDPSYSGFAVTAWDFMEAHPEVTWDEIYTP